MRRQPQMFLGAGGGVKRGSSNTHWRKQPSSPFPAPIPHPHRLPGLTASSTLSLTQHPVLRRTKKELDRCVLPGGSGKGSEGNRVSRPLMLLSKQDLFHRSWRWCVCVCVQVSKRAQGDGPHGREPGVLLPSSPSVVSWPLFSQASPRLQKVRSPFKVETLLICIPSPPINQLLVVSEPFKLKNLCCLI